MEQQSICALYRDRFLPRRVIAACYRRVPPVRGYQRPLGHLNSFFLRVAARPIVVGQMEQGHRLVLDLRAGTEFRSYYTGRYDNDRIQLLLRLIPRDSIVLDIGANVGFYAVPFGMHVKRCGGIVHAFEPVSTNFRRLEENIALNGLNQHVRTHRMALSSHAGTGAITLREDFANGATTGNASIVINDGSDDRFEIETVRLATLDEIDLATGDQRIGLIKIDVEGHEDLVFEGGLETIARHRPIIAAELNEDYFRRREIDVDTRITEILGRLDYIYLGPSMNGRWERIDHLHGRGATDDVLLVPREQMEVAIGALRDAD